MNIPRQAKALKEIAQKPNKYDNRPALNCVHVREGEAWATDSFKLLRVKWDISAEVRQTYPENGHKPAGDTVSVDAKELAELAKLTDRATTPCIAENIGAVTEGGVYAADTNAEKFIEAKNVTPPNHDTLFPDKLPEPMAFFDVELIMGVCRALKSAGVKQLGLAPLRPEREPSRAPWYIVSPDRYDDVRIDGLIMPYRVR